MDQNPFSGLGLQPVTLADQATLSTYLNLLSEPLSDYTFSQLFTWSHALRIFWRILDDHLCVFANGSGDLTMLLPPLGDGNSDRALASAYEIMDAYNAAAGTPDRGRVEYASDEMLRRFDTDRLDILPLSVDYLYDTRRMIDLAGGDLASKRQAKNRFMRNYAFRAAPYDRALHLEPCRALLHQWRQYQDTQHQSESSTSAVKRLKESLSCEAALEHADELGLRGLVVYVDDPAPAHPSDAPAPVGGSIRGFTFGEFLGHDQASIVIEKTDLQVKGLAQYIFSAFCETAWADRPFINVGDDWGLQTLAWTKMSYRPVRLLQKSTFRRRAALRLAVPHPVAPADEIRASLAAMLPVPDDPPAMNLPLPPVPLAPPPAIVRRATRGDVPAAVTLEAQCFSAHCLTRRQLQYLQQRPSVVFLVAEDQGRIVGEGIALLRRTRRGVSGRIYSLAVDPQSRGRRIGQRLLQEMIDQLIAHGAQRIFLEVETDNTLACQMYQRHGFRSIGVLHDYYGTGRNGVHMLFEVSSADRPPACPAAATTAA